MAEERTCADGVLSGTYAFPACTVAGPGDCVGPDSALIQNGTTRTYYQAANVPSGQECVSEERGCTNGVLGGTFVFATCTVASPADCVGPDTVLIPNGESRTYYEAATVPSGQACVSEQRTCSNGSLSGTFGFASCVVCSWTNVGGCPCTPTACDLCDGVQQQEDGCGNQRTVSCSVPATGCLTVCCTHECCPAGDLCYANACCTPDWQDASACDCQATIGSGCTGNLSQEDGCGGSRTQACSLPIVGRVSAPYTAVSHEDHQDNAGLMIDCPLSTFRSGSSRYWIATTNGPPNWIVRHTKAIGTLERPFVTKLWEKDQATLFSNPTGAGGVWWIANVYQHPDGLLAFVHVEAVDMDCDPSPCRGKGRMGLAWSTDMGEHFTYLGHIISPYGDPDDMVYANVHGTPYVVHQGYIYMYYMDNGVFTIARAPVDAVIQAARSGTTSAWNKWYNNQWTEPGLGGNRQSMPFGGIVHSDATFSTTTGKYYLIISWMNWSNADTFINVYEADDPITWSTTPRNIVLQPFDQVRTGYQYTTFVDATGADNGSAGPVFYLYSMKDNGATDVNGAYRWTIDLEGGTFRRFSEQFSGVQGQDHWYYDSAAGGDLSQLTPMQWFSGQRAWRPAGSVDALAVLRAGGGHAGTSVDLVFRWVAPQAGHVELTGVAYDIQGACGDGIVATLYEDSVQLWQGTIANNDTVGAGHRLMRWIDAGHAFLFRVNRRANSDCDGFRWDPNIDYVTGSWQYSSEYTTVHTERWAYQYHGAGVFYDMAYSGGWWRGPEANLQLGSVTHHPGATYDSALRWTAPAAGRIELSATITDTHAGCGDGIVASIQQKSSAGLSTIGGPYSIADGGFQAYSFEATVSTGDTIHFVVNRKSTMNCDSTQWDPRIVYCGDTCP